MLTTFVFFKIQGSGANKVTLGILNGLEIKKTIKLNFSIVLRFGTSLAQ